MADVPNGRFGSEEDGAVTIDWVVLTAALPTLGVVLATIISRSSTDESRGLGSSLANATVPSVDWDGP
jgi:hypothetical protein